MNDLMHIVLNYYRCYYYNYIIISTDIIQKKMSNSTKYSAFEFDIRTLSCHSKKS